MREDKNIYSMTTISQKEIRLRRKNILIIWLLSFAIYNTNFNYDKNR